MAQTPRGGLYGSPSKGHHGVCAIYSETTVINLHGTWNLQSLPTHQHPHPLSSAHSRPSFKRELKRGRDRLSLLPLELRTIHMPKDLRQTRQISDGGDVSNLNGDAQDK